MLARILVMMLFAMPALADDVRIARDAYQDATKHYDLREFKDALIDFTTAYRAKADPAFLFNIAQCHRQLGQYEAARQFYAAYIRRGGDSSAQELVDEMDKAIAEQHAEVPPTGTREPPAVIVPQEPPAAATPAKVAVPQVSSVNRIPRPTLVLAGGGVVLAIGGAIAIGVAAERYQLAQGSCAPNCTDGEVSNIRNVANTSYVLFVGAALAAVAAIAVFLIDRRPRDAKRIAIAPTSNGLNVNF